MSYISQACKIFNKLIQKTEVQIGILILIPQIIMLCFSIACVSWNNEQLLNYSDLFFQNVYNQQLDMIKSQNSLVIQNHQEQAQYELEIINILQKIYIKKMSGSIIFNKNFTKPVLNIQKTYDQIGDLYLLNIYKNNRSEMISSWYQKDTLTQNELSLMSQDQINNASLIDFIWKSALVAKNNQPFQLKQIQINIKSYFFAFSQDGMFYGTGANMTYKNIRDKPPCPKSQFNMDSRCQEYYQAATSNPDFITSYYPPTQFMYDSQNQPYISMGICKKIFLSSVLIYQYKIAFSGEEKQQVFCIICNSIPILQNYTIFNLPNYLKATFIILDPQTLRVAFQSDYQQNGKNILNFYDSYLYKLESQTQSDEILNQIKIFTNNKFDQEMIMIMEFSYIIDKNTQEYDQGSPQTFYCFLDNLLLITIIPKDQMIKQTAEFQKQINNIDVIFKLVFYFFVGLCLILTVYQSKKSAGRINYSVEHLTQILTKINLDKETQYLILFDNVDNLFQDYEVDDIFLSSDMFLLYESFKNLFQTLMYTTQNSFDSNQSSTLLNLSKQIQYFKKFENYRALGICYNNIGNIHFSQGRYIEALQNYSSSIICCKYELNLFRENNVQMESFSKSFIHESYQESWVLKKEQLQILNSVNIEQSPKNIFFKSQDYQLHKKDNEENGQSCNYASQKIESTEQTEENQNLYQTLFNRKYNQIITMIYYMVQNENNIQNWEIAEEYITQLMKIKSRKLVFNIKENIILNQLFIYILMNQKKFKQCDAVLKKSFQLEQQLKLIKTQDINIINNILSVKQEKKSQSDHTEVFLNTQNNYLSSPIAMKKITKQESFLIENYGEIQSQNNSQRNLLFENSKSFNNNNNNTSIFQQKNLKQSCDDSTHQQNFNSFNKSPTMSNQRDFYLKKTKNLSYFHDNIRANQSKKNTLILNEDSDEQQVQHQSSQKKSIRQNNKKKSTIALHKSQLNQSNSRYLENKGEHQNLYDFNDDIIHVIVLDQVATLALAKQQFYQATDAITKILEESQFCQNIIEQVLIRQDDCFGFISSSLSDMFISENIALMSLNQIDKSYLRQQIIDSYYKIQQQLLLKFYQQQDPSTYDKDKKFELFFQEKFCHEKINKDSFDLNSVEISNQFLQESQIINWRQKQHFTEKKQNDNQKPVPLNQEIQIESSKDSKKIDLLSPINEEPHIQKTFFQLNQVQNIENTNEYQLKKSESFQNINELNFIQKEQLENAIINQNRDKCKPNQFLYKQNLKYQQYFLSQKNFIIEEELTKMQSYNERSQSLLKAIQQLLSQNNQSKLNLQLYKVQYEKEKYIPSNKQYNILRQHYSTVKQQQLLNINPTKKLEYKFYKKYIIVAVDNLKIIDQDEFNEFSTKEQSTYTYKEIDNTRVVSFFFCEKSLVNYLIFNRFTKYHDSAPLVVEHF
ncbi:hypothetical protein ABPG74_020453 [Tetrahymena malaccensis]